MNNRKSKQQKRIINWYCLTLNSCDDHNLATVINNLMSLKLFIRKEYGQKKNNYWFWISIGFDFRRNNKLYWDCVLPAPYFNKQHNKSKSKLLFFFAFYFFLNLKCLNNWLLKTIKNDELLSANLWGLSLKFRLTEQLRIKWQII